MKRITDIDVFNAFPSAQIDHDNIAQFRGRLEKHLLINRCADCGHWHNPPRAVCPVCWSGRVLPTEVQGGGRIVLLTVLHHGPPVVGVDYSVGYPVAAVDLSEEKGLRFTATLTGAALHDYRIGMGVRCTWFEREGVPVPAFSPDNA